MSIWKESVKKLEEPINCLVGITKLLTPRSFGINKNGTLPAELTYVRKELKEATHLSEAMNKKESYSNITFKFIVNCMGGKEDVNLLYTMIQVIFVIIF